VSRAYGALFAVGLVGVAGLAYLMSRKPAELPPDDEVPPAEAADLRVESIAVDRDPPEYGYSVPFVLTVTVTNHGNISGSLAVYRGYLMKGYLGSGQYVSFQKNNPETITLAAGQTGTLVRNISTPTAGEMGGDWWQAYYWALGRAPTVPDMLTDAKMCYIDVRPEWD
jgi:hypothetical protein